MGIFKKKEVVPPSAITTVSNMADNLSNGLSQALGVQPQEQVVYSQQPQQMPQPKVMQQPVQYQQQYAPQPVYEQQGEDYAELVEALKEVVTALDQRVTILESRLFRRGV